MRIHSEKKRDVRLDWDFMLSRSLQIFRIVRHRRIFDDHVRIPKVPLSMLSENIFDGVDMTFRQLPFEKNGSALECRQRRRKRMLIGKVRDREARTVFQKPLCNAKTALVDAKTHYRDAFIPEIFRFHILQFILS